LDDGSIRATTPAPKIATQTAPSVAVIPACSFAPTSMLARMRFVAGSIRVTADVPNELTHTEPAPNAIPYGDPGNAMRAPTRFRRGSIRETEASP